MNRKIQGTMLGVVCTLGIGINFALAIPAPDAEGDYRIPSTRGNRHINWVVVDSDPKGLNCRMAKEFQQFSLDGADAPAALYENKRHNIGQWPVVATFREGDRLQAVTGNFAQQIMLTDLADQPWLPIEISSQNNSRNCFIRANRRFIRPLKEDPNTLKPIE